MKRDLPALARGEHDVLVVGGGIYGVCIAREAALRGFRTALIERGDFGSETSWNSMRIVHGGLRYLQTLDLVRARESIREQAAWLRIAPGLVRPRAFVVPTYAGSRRGRTAMRAGLAIHELLRLGCGPGVGRGRILGREECLENVPHVATEGLTGAALWHEGVIESSERLVLAILRAAVDAGAVVANHTEAVSWLRNGERVAGARVRDALEGEELDVRARAVVDARGPGSGYPPGGRPRPNGMRWARAMNLVTRPLPSTCAVGVSSQRGEGRLWFVVPWRDASLVGTAYFPAREAEETPTFDDGEIEGVVREVAAALPGAGLRTGDVRLVHGGLVPVQGWGADGEAALASRPLVEERDGVLRVVGVKYTTARSVAESVVDRLAARTGTVRPSSTSATTPLPDAGDPTASAVRSELADDALRRLETEYRGAASRIVALARKDPEARAPLVPGGEAIAAEVLYAVREEMAATLGDVVFRRTPLGVAGDPGEPALVRAASLVARELGWGGERTARELEAVRAFLVRHRARPARHEPRAAVP